MHIACPQRVSPQTDETSTSGTWRNSTQRFYNTTRNLRCRFRSHSIKFLHFYLFPLFSLASPPQPVSPPAFMSLAGPHITSSLPLSGQKMDRLINSTRIVPFSNNNQLKIAIIGFGNYGQYLAKTLVSQGHVILAHSRSDHSFAANSLGVTFYYDVRDLWEEHPDVVLFCTSIISTEEVLKSLPLHSIKGDTLFVDVLWVKEFAKSLFLKVLPENFDVICCHPMFGPQNAKLAWEGFDFVYEKVRIGNEEYRVDRCKRFLEIFVKEGCKMVEMSCEEHDKYAAGSQFITHTVGRVLKILNLDSTPINTKGYESLLELVENVGEHSFDMYFACFVFNGNALDMLERLSLAFKELRNQLVGRLHDVVSKQLFANDRNGYYRNGSVSAVNATAMSSQDSGQRRDYRLHNNNSSLKIGIVGFGNFGQFLARAIVLQGHSVLAYSRTDCSDVAKKLGVSYFLDVDDLCKERPDVILLCTSILSTEKVLKSLPLQRLKRSTLFVDVLSVKEFPRNLLLNHLPPEFDILCTHPMFGPESGKNGWNGLSFVFDKVRVGTDAERKSCCDRFLDIFAQQGCRMVEMSCAEHDQYAAGSQFITHTVGRTLEKLGLESTPINTKGYNTLLKLVEITAGDSFDLYYGLFLYNPNAMEQLERFELAFESLKKQLFGRSHGLLRKQLVENVETSRVLKNQLPLLNLHQDHTEQPTLLEAVSSLNN